MTKEYCSILQRKRRRKQFRGQSLVELLAGLCILLPIVLVLLDFSVVVIAKMTNDTLARNAARAAAEAHVDMPLGASDDERKAAYYSAALGAVGEVVTHFNQTHQPGTGIAHLAALTPPDQTRYTQDEIVEIRSSLMVHLPIPVPGYGDSVSVDSFSKQPVISLANTQQNQ